MKILHVCTYPTGGAGRACINLHKSLANLGVDSNLLVKKNRNNELIQGLYIYKQPIKKISLWAKINFRIRKLSDLLAPIKSDEKDENHKYIEFLKDRSANLEYYSIPKSNNDITSQDIYKEADIIHLHWVADLLDWESFLRNNTKPVVWTLHDEAPYLAFEHYDEEYLGIDDSGKPMSRVKTNGERELDEILLNYKINTLNRYNPKLHLVANSKWTMNRSKSSNVFNNYSHSCIYYGFPPEFKPLNQGVCREIFNLPTDKFLILFVAENINNERKGLKYLLSAIDKLVKDKTNSPYLLISVGQNNSQSLNNHVNLGPISDNRFLSIVYSAADVFVIPSIMEAFGQTTVEANLCGTPAVGFPIGGIKEVIKNGFNGYLCDEVSVNSLANTIQKMYINYKSFDRQEIAKASRKSYDLNLQAQKYVGLYDSLINRF